MPDAQQIEQQQNLLSLHRRTLAHYVQQRAQLGAAYTPPGVTHGIDEARRNIRQIKATLRQWNAAVDDHPDDDEAPAAEATPAAQPLPATPAPAAAPASTPPPAPPKPVALAEPSGNPFTPGQVVPPGRFKGRQRELKEVLSGLESMLSVLLVGEARIGKSSMLKFLQANLPDQLRSHGQYLPIYMSGGSTGNEGCCDVEHFCETLLRQLLPVLRPHLSAEQAQIVQRLEQRLNDDLPLRLDDTVNTVRWARSYGLRVVVLLDEFKRLLDQPDVFSDSFFDSLRSLYTNGNIALVLAIRHDIGDLPELDRVHTYFANGTTTIQLNRLRPDESKKLLEQPHTRPFSEDQIQRGLQIGDNHPLRLQRTGWLLYNWHAQPRIDWRDLRRRVDQEYERAMRASRRPAPRKGGVGRWIEAAGRMVMRTGDGIDAFNARLYGLLLILGIVIIGVMVSLFLAGVLTFEQVRQLLQEIRGS